MRRRIERTRGARGRAAAIAVGALLAAASVVPATAAQAASATTVRGTVEAGSARLSGVPVGFWSRTGTRIASTTSDAGGAFTLRVPSGARGFAYAGTRPDATKAVFALSGKWYVRGVIGATQGATTSSPLYQGHTSASAAKLAGGAAVHFRLQEPGRVRVDGGKFLRAGDGSLGTVELRRLNGGQADLLRPDAAGVFTSKPVVPGDYAIYSFPVAPYLPRTVPVTVGPGATTTISPSFASGATVRGRVTSGGDAAAGVEVTALRGGSVVYDATTDAGGHYVLGAVAPGRYRLRFGYNRQPDRDEGLESEVDQTQATSDDYLPATQDLAVAPAAAPVTIDASLRRAGHVKGTVTGLGQEESPRVWLEDSSHRIVRTRVVGLAATRTYDLGGLVPGRTYTVYAATFTGSATDSKYGVRTFTATAGTVSRNITVSTRTLTLRGVAAGAARGTVSVRAQGTALPLLGRGGKVDATGHYVVRGLIPGAYEAAVTPANPRVRLASRWHRLTLTRSTTQDLAAGPRPGSYRARFVSGAAPVATVNGSAADAAGDVLFLSTGSNGRALYDTARPGGYRYQPATWAPTVPAFDGPWWFGAPAGGFTITAGRTTNLGTVALHLHARL